MPSTESVSHDDLIVCACGNQEYKARDAIHAALFRGELESKWTEFLRRVEAERRADEMDMDFDGSALDTAAEGFRYDHDLITAEETEQWLATRGLTLDDFSDYFARQHCASMLSEEVTPGDVDYLSAPIELRQLFAAELILSGDLDWMTTQLIWRLAARSAAKDSDADAVAEEERRFFDRHQIGSAQLPNWLERLGRDSQWFSEMLAREAAYRQRCETLLVQQARQHELVALRLPLTRFETEMIELESRDAAQEALFCVREDGMSMEEVATEGRYPYRRVVFLLEDIPADLQQRFLSVSAGDVLEPIGRGEGFELCRIIKKIEPHPDDPAVRLRIEQRILDRHFADLSSKYVERRLGASIPAE
jgi:hypothetical protein